jgi:hypothetical protein
MTKKKKKLADLSDSDYELMLSSKRNILHAKRLWRFYEAQFYFSLIFMTPVIGSVLRIYKVGLESYILLLLIIIPPFLICLMLIYRRSELNFLEVVNSKTREQNYMLLKKSIRDLNWRIENESQRHVEAFTGQGLGFTWGDEMVTAVIADNTILINCLCNLDYYKAQGFFTFGKLTRITKKLKNQIELEP